MFVSSLRYKDNDKNIVDTICHLQPRDGRATTHRAATASETFRHFTWQHVHQARLTSQSCSSSQ
jgi:hypothetical protein